MPPFRHPLEYIFDFSLFAYVRATRNIILPFPYTQAPSLVDFISGNQFKRSSLDCFIFNIRPSMFGYNVTLGRWNLFVAYGTMFHRAIISCDIGLPKRRLRTLQSY